MSSEIILEIRLCILKRHAVVLENCMHLEPRFETKQAPHLALGQGASAIALHCKRFQRLLGEIRPSALQGFRNVIRQIEGDLHSYSQDIDESECMRGAWSRRCRHGVGRRDRSPEL